MSDCRENRLLLGAYVLGGLEPVEADRLDAHLASCPSCKQEHERLASVVSLVALAGPPDLAALPDGFEERLVTHARQTRNPSMHSPRSQWRNLRSGRLGTALGGALAGAAATAALLFGFGALSGSAPSQPATLIADLSATAQAPNASAVIYVINSKNASTVALEARGLPGAAPDQHYEVWLSSQRGSYSVGTIDVTRSGWSTALLHSPKAVLPGSLVNISLVSSNGAHGAYRPLVEGTVGS
jgi:anti-sigma factor RsiW